MDLSKKAVLIQWLNKLNPHLVIESLSDLREGEQFIALLNKIKATSYDVNTKKERFEIIQKFIEDKYDYKLVEQVNFDKDNELDFAKIAVLVLAAGVKGGPQEEFMKAALSLNEQSQLEIMSILKQALNLPLYNFQLDNLFTHKHLEIFDSENNEHSEMPCHDTSWSSDKSAIHANYEIKEKNILLKKLDHELEYERHHCFELECNLKVNKKIISSKDDKIQELNNQIRDLKKLQDQLDDYHNLKDEYDKLEATATRVKSQSDELKSLKSENTLLINENTKLYEELNKMKEMISNKQHIIEKLTEDAEPFYAKESYWEQTEARYNSELQQQVKTNPIHVELSNVRIELALILKKMVNFAQNLERNKKTQNKMKLPKQEEMLLDYENSLLKKQELEYQLESEQRLCKNLREKIKVGSEENQSLMKQLKQLQNLYNSLQKRNDMLNNKCIKTQNQLSLKEKKCTEFEKKLARMAVEKLTMEKRYVNELEQPRQTLSQKLKENIDPFEKQNKGIKADQDDNEMKRDFTCINEQRKEKQVKTEKEYNEITKELKQCLNEKDEQVKSSKQQILKIQNAHRQELTKNKSLEEQIKVLKLKHENRIVTLIKLFQSHINQLKFDHDMVFSRIKTDYNNYKRKVNEMSKVAYADHKEMVNQLTKYMIENDKESKTSKQEIVKIQSAYEEKSTECKSLEKEIEVLKDCHSRELASSQSQCEELQQALRETISNCEKILSDKKMLMMLFEYEQMSEKKIYEEEINELNRIINEVRNECQQWKKASTELTKLEIATSRELEVLKKKHENLCSKIESLKKELKTTKEEKGVVIGKLQDYEIFNLLFTAMCCSLFMVPFVGLTDSV
ncbi:leucine-rich repeat and coiled-coil domain-containing protein 1-like isoform X2 [Octopus sinensis]|uniref:Leucine-rich repeat and coiled-coil domain-containing protein 1-like isoform X2 n=1 Tax=Octopus sinensis TaxID=2607531 RepID=A0A7E6F6R5_9MOLL|nr:leucine-rich repeat and coiled-coil domain-containing protein 1-like isoform X2 [Octopus sinensis]